MFTQDIDIGPCRSVQVNACEADVEVNGAISALGVFQIPLRDQLDFTVDFGPWIAAAGNPNMPSAMFAVASGSPASPIIVGQGSIPAGIATIVLAAALNAKAGDAYYIDIVAMFDAVPATPTAPSIGARKITRRINVVVVTG